MGINGFQQDFNQRAPLVDGNGILTNDGKQMLLALWNRTGAGSGFPNVEVDLVATVAAPANLAADWNSFSLVAAGASAIIPPLKVGADFIVFNGGANPLLVTPQAGVQIDALAVGAGYSLAAAKMQWFRCWTPSLIRSTQLG